MGVCVSSTSVWPHRSLLALVHGARWAGASAAGRLAGWPSGSVGAPPSVSRRDLTAPPRAGAAQACHNAVKRAWARTTRTYTRQQKQRRRPSYRLRQSSGAPSRDGSAEEGEGDAAPALVAARHMRT